MIKFIVSVGVMLLTACSAVTPVTAQIPITVDQYAPNIPKKPYLPIYSLTKESTPDVVFKSYVASVQILDGYSDSLLTILRGY